MYARSAYTGFLSRLANDLQTRVVVPAYRLAPEHPFPAAIDDCLRAYEALLDAGQEPGQLMIAGDGRRQRCPRHVAAGPRRLPPDACGRGHAQRRLRLLLVQPVDQHQCGLRHRTGGAWAGIPEAVVPTGCRCDSGPGRDLPDRSDVHRAASTGIRRRPCRTVSRTPRSTFSSSIPSSPKSARRSSPGPPTSSICSRWARRTSARTCWRCAARLDRKRSAAVMPRKKTSPGCSTPEAPPGGPRPP